MPGTGSARESGLFFQMLWRSVLPKLIPLLRRFLVFRTATSQESGADLASWASEQVTSGVYFEGSESTKSSLSSYKESKQEDLWTWTVINVAEGVENLEVFK